MVLWVNSGTAQRSVCFLFSISAQILLQMQTDIRKALLTTVWKQLIPAENLPFPDEETETQGTIGITAECGLELSASHTNFTSPKSASERQLRLEAKDACLRLRALQP